mmetsp:Transcript_18054/g.46841  ORF Transcript_18054/g.46841 Transcript_18054/m.46841 type:complete len:245 (+) Transcript_18054:83-817(+)
MSSAGAAGAAIGAPNASEVHQARWARALEACPVVAILRGIRPAEVLEVARALVSEGIRIVEVPLNSPDALESIRLLADADLGEDVMVGAGTVLTPEDVDLVAKAGGSLIVSPNMDEQVIRRTKVLGLVSFPGVATPTEAFAALRYGADGLKAFPGEQIPPNIIKAWRAVLPADTCLMPVGGVSTDNMQDYWSSGASGFGVGTSLFKPGDGAREARAKAAAFVAAFRRLSGPGGPRAAKRARTCQ